MKRILSLICAALMLLLVCVGCHREPGNETDGTAQEEQSSSVPIWKDGKLQIRLIRPDNADDGEIKAMTSLSGALERIFGQSPELGTDFSKDASGTGYELLIGRTNYPESQTVADQTPYGEYTVCVEGNKIVLYTHISSELTMVVDYFSDYLKSHIRQGSDFTFSGTDALSGVLHREMLAYPTFTGVFPAAYELSDASAHQFLFLKCTADSVQNYSQKLLDNGYSEVSDREVVGIRYRTYRSEKGAITTSFQASDGTLRLILEPEKNLFIQDDNSYTPVTTPQLIMIGDRFQDSPVLNGLMCFLIRLSDGRFIIVDGGVAHEGFSDKIYNTMVEQSGGKEDVTVAAWFFTHSHNDHIGGFLSLCARHAEHVNIERFVFNFASQATATAMEPGAANDAKRTRAAIGQYYPGAIVNKCHAGQVYEIADARIEMYYTPDEYLTASRRLANSKNFNETSLIFSVDIGGQRITFLGDSQNIPNNETAARYGSYLKSDFVQVAHHGGVGGTASIYRAIDAQVALLTTDDSRVVSFLSTSYNQAMLKNPSMKEYYNVHDRIYIFDLPYTPTGSGWIK